MESFTIVKQFNVLEDFHPCLISRLIIAVVNEFVLERAEEAFSHTAAHLLNVINDGSVTSRKVMKSSIVGLSTNWNFK
jgi:hypothetical protein